MKTQIIIKQNWEIIKEYDFLITMTDQDIVEHEDIEYRVQFCCLDISINTMQIIIN